MLDEAIEYLKQLQLQVQVSFFLCLFLFMVLLCFAIALWCWILRVEKIASLKVSRLVKLLR